MRVVVALGGNALLKRGEPMTADNQRANVRVAAQALARVAADHDLVVSHGNGPQVGLLALQGAAYKDVEAYPLDILGAETQGMIGYLVEQELRQPAAVRATAGDDPDDGRGRPGRPRVQGPDQVRRSRVRRGDGQVARRGEGLGREAGRGALAACRSVAPTAAHLRAAADAVGAGARGRRDLRRRRRDPDDLQARREPRSRRHRGRDRQGPGHAACSRAT